MYSGKIWLCALALVAVSAHAEENTNNTAAESKIKVEDAKGTANKASGGDIDNLITNAKLRAETGSKSKWSLSSALGYSGGSVETPLSDIRPNISGTTGALTKSVLEGSISTKYNMNMQNSLSAGVGVRWITPLQGNAKRSGDQFDASNPYLTYQRLYKFSGIQSVLQVTPTAYTNSNLLREGYVGSLAVSQDMIYEVGATGLSLGLYAWVQGATYNKSGPLGSPNDKDYMADMREDQSDYGGGLDPFLEYQFNDKVNLRTVCNLWNYEHIRNEGRPTTFRWDKVYQSVGVGLSITRDIFVYPNLQFLPDNIRADRTNVGLNTNINVF